MYVYVRWTDAAAYGGAGWTDVDEALEWAAKPPPVFNTVGILLHACETHIVLTSTLDAECCGVQEKIPRQWIEEAFIIGWGKPCRPIGSGQGLPHKYTVSKEEQS